MAGSTKLLTSSGGGVILTPASNISSDVTVTVPSLNGNLITDTSLGLTGQIAFFAVNAAPTGWLKANGAAVSRTTYASLFAAISTTFGSGDGSTTFNLPDLRGYFPRGWADNGSVDSGRTFGTTQADDFKSHSHVMPNQAYGLNGTAGSSMWTVTNGPANTNATGGTETRPVNIALLACIKY